MVVHGVQNRVRHCVERLLFVERFDQLLGLIESLVSQAGHHQMHVGETATSVLVEMRLNARMNLAPGRLSRVLIID